jgi:hypothetical protein
MSVSSQNFDERASCGVTAHCKAVPIFGQNG